MPGFKGLRGHQATLERLGRALARRQLHHALLFVGPRGVGKATVARALGRALHCQVEPGWGCGQCTSCARIDHGRHTGVEWVVPEAPGASIKVEQARELATRVQQAPFEGDAHLVVLDPAEALTDQAFNALLKTLEEPRPGVHFVLIAAALDGLLPTILSRCAILRFGRLDDVDVGHIIAQALADQPDVPQARRDLATALADGSAGVAIDLALDASLDQTQALLHAAALAALAGPAEIFRGDAGALGQSFAAATAGPTTGKPARERGAVLRMADLWLLHLREKLRGRAGIPGLATVGRDPSEWRQAGQILLELQAKLERNANAKLVLEQALLELGDLAQGDDARP